MVKNHPSDWNVTTEAEFDAALEQLLENALKNGVDSRGSWVYNTDRSSLDLETVIVELQNGESEAT